jgi:hypothetical protein
VTQLEDLVPWCGIEKKEIWTAYLPHAIYVAGFSDPAEESLRASLWERVGRCYTILAQYSGAENAH